MAKYCVHWTCVKVDEARLNKFLAQFAGLRYTTDVIAAIWPTASPTPQCPDCQAALEVIESGNGPDFEARWRWSEACGTHRALLVAENKPCGAPAHAPRATLADLARLGPSLGGWAADPRAAACCRPHAASCPRWPDLPHSHARNGMTHLVVPQHIAYPTRTGLPLTVITEAASADEVWGTHFGAALPGTTSVRHPADMLNALVAGVPQTASTADRDALAALVTAWWTRITWDSHARLTPDARRLITPSARACGWTRCFD